MVRFINRVTGGDMWVHESRVEEYKAAGHRLAAQALDTGTAQTMTHSEEENAPEEENTPEEENAPEEETKSARGKGRKKV